MVLCFQHWRSNSWLLTFLTLPFSYCPLPNSRVERHHAASPFVGGIDEQGRPEVLLNKHVWDRQVYAIQSDNVCHNSYPFPSECLSKLTHSLHSSPIPPPQTCAPRICSLTLLKATRCFNRDIVLGLEWKICRLQRPKPGLEEDGGES
jgi:hypothetical protein